MRKVPGPKVNCIERELEGDGIGHGAARVMGGVVDRRGDSGCGQRCGVRRDPGVDQTHELRSLRDLGRDRPNLVKDIFVDAHAGTSTTVCGMRCTARTGERARATAARKERATPAQSVSRRPTVSPRYPATI